MTEDEPIDMHEVRMLIGTGSMEISDAIDEDFLQLLATMDGPFVRAYRHLLDSGVSEIAAASFMHGACSAAIDRARQ